MNDKLSLDIINEVEICHGVKCVLYIGNRYEGGYILLNIS